MYIFIDDTCYILKLKHHLMLKFISIEYIIELN